MKTKGPRFQVKLNFKVDLNQTDRKGSRVGTVDKSILLIEFDLDLPSGYWKIFFDHRAYNRPRCRSRDSSAAPEAELDLVVTSVRRLRSGSTG